MKSTIRSEPCSTFLKRHCVPELRQLVSALKSVTEAGQWGVQRKAVVADKIQGLVCRRGDLRALRQDLNTESDGVALVPSCKLWDQYRRGKSSC